MATNGDEVSFGMMKMFWNRIVVVVLQFCEYTKNNRIVHFKRVDFMISLFLKMLQF